MKMYNPKSLKAEEFINHEEILDTLDYAEKNKHNRELIEQILEKAKPRKTARGVECSGLSHREVCSIGITQTNLNWLLNFRRK